MRSLRARLWALWTLAIAAALCTGLVLTQLYLGSAAARLGQARAMSSHACDQIRDRYRFYIAGWTPPEITSPKQVFGDELVPVVSAALAAWPSVGGGVWSIVNGPLVTFRATIDPGLLSDTANAAAREEQTVSRRVNSRAGVLLLSACPLPGPIDNMIAWASITVDPTGDMDLLRQGLALLLLLIVGLATGTVWLTNSFGRRIAGIVRHLAAQSDAVPAPLARTGTHELDRIVDALNESGQRLEAARARARDAEHLAGLGRMAAGVAHEIRNPMGAMRLRLENALAGEDGRQRPAIQACLAIMTRVDRLLGELLVMTTRRTPDRQSIDLPAFVQARLDEHRDRAVRAGLTLHAEIDPPSGMACFDQNLIGRAIDNLLLNAIAHTPPGGRITASAHRDATMLRLAVTDTGPGVDAAMRSRAFEPFVTTRPDGTGLGLPIAREMAQAHGGRLMLSPMPGQGARFILELPQSDACPPS